MKVFLALPALDGKIHDLCVESIILNIHFLMSKGIEVIPYIRSNMIYVEKVRNVCVKQFLDSDCTDIVFVDSDLGFDKDAIWKLLSQDKDMIAGVYPYKKDNYAFPAIIDFDEQNNCKEESTGLVYARIVPTGLLRIKRKVFEEMLKKSGEGTGYPILKDKDDIYTFFQTGMIFPDDNNYYGEDVAFCIDWGLMGGKIFIEPRINFTHIGTKHFKGNFHDYLMGRSVDLMGVEGWGSRNEMTILKYFASKCMSIAEIGSWKGRSTKELLETCPGLVYAIDTWNGSESDITSVLSKNENIYQEFLNNVGNYSNLRILKMKSLDAVKQIDSVDMAYIDADHTYEACKNDIEAWLPKCKKFICGHDYTDQFPGVKQAVDELLGKVSIIDTLWIKEI